MQIDAATATVIAAIVGAGVGGLVTLIGQCLTQRSKERMQFRQIVMQAAIKNWRVSNEEASKYIEAGHKVTRYPLDTFILHMMKLTELLNQRNVTPELVKAKLEEVKAVTAIAVEHAERTD